MSGLRRDELRPDDIRRAVEVAAQAMTPLNDADWSAKAGDLDWDCRRTLGHTNDAVVWYAANLAMRSADDVDVVDFDREARIERMLSTLVAGGNVLAATVEGSAAGARGYHGAGMADATGFLAMGCDETLVHTYDVCAGLGTPFEGPADIAGRIVERIFPWAPDHADPWELLLWCNGRMALPGHARLGSEWGWWCAPLDEWDGVAYTDRWPGD
ncbi:MAG TPA: hypothetical protein VEM41_05700 [Actinomycetota bacterium]|nr:hypothetical protein [Actinomycetota bacterium]